MPSPTIVQPTAEEMKEIIFISGLRTYVAAPINNSGGVPPPPPPPPSGPGTRSHGHG